MNWKGLVRAAGLGLGLGLLVHYSLLGYSAKSYFQNTDFDFGRPFYRIEEVNEGPEIVKIKDASLQEGWIIVMEEGQPETWTALVRHQNGEQRVFKRLKRQSWGKRMLVRVGISEKPNPVRIPQTSRVLKTVGMEATAYDPGPVNYERGYVGRTSIGKRAQFGIVAVDPKEIAYRSLLYVDGYGPGLAADTGGDIKGKRIDLCFNSTREALRYGRRKTKLHVLGWVSAQERRRIRLALSQE